MLDKLAIKQKTSYLTTGNASRHMCMIGPIGFLERESLLTYMIAPHKTSSIRARDAAYGTMI